MSMLEPLRKYADFEGRARRSEYWMFILFQIILVIGMMFVGAILIGTAYAVGGDPEHNTLGMAAAIILTCVLILVGVALIIPNLAVSVRRLHDSDKSGFWLFLHLLPCGGLVVLVFKLLDGTPGDNRYGPDPKGRQGGTGPTIVHHHHYSTPEQAPPAV